MDPKISLTVTDFRKNHLKLTSVYKLLLRNIKV